ncbi:unnamed protein product [Urochloa decumbens]|uniref:Uncharacterized protein n=1 Tax=Urochloa decumbens TaxID=240449 RepID=A0ABC8WXT0_9POAL
MTIVVVPLSCSTLGAAAACCPTYSSRSSSSRGSCARGTSAVLLGRRRGVLMRRGQVVPSRSCCSCTGTAATAGVRGCGAYLYRCRRRRPDPCGPRGGDPWSHDGSPSGSSPDARRSRGGTGLAAAPPSLDSENADVAKIYTIRLRSAPTARPRSDHLRKGEIRRQITGVECI